MYYSHLTPISPIPDGGPSVAYEPPFSAEPESSHLWSIYTFPILQDIAIQVNGGTEFWRRLRGRFVVHINGNVSESFLTAQLLLHYLGLRFKPGSIWQMNGIASHSIAVTAKSELNSLLVYCWSTQVRKKWLKIWNPEEKESLLSGRRWKWQKSEVLSGFLMSSWESPVLYQRWLKSSRESSLLYLVLLNNFPSPSSFCTKVIFQIKLESVCHKPHF